MSVKKSFITHCPEHKLAYVARDHGLWVCPIEDCFHHAHDETAAGFQIVFCFVCGERVFSGYFSPESDAEIEINNRLEQHMKTHRWWEICWVQIRNKIPWL